jgi:hypothetical protein
VTSIRANIRLAVCRSRFASVGRPVLVPWPVALATSHSSACRTWSAVASTGACSAALTITRTWSTRNRPATKASRVAAYFSWRSRAMRSPPAACSRVLPVSRASQASVPVSAVSSATRRRSASADNAHRNAAARDSTRASADTAAPSASSPSDPTGASPARARHWSTSANSDPIVDSTTGGVGDRSSSAMPIPVWYRTHVRSTRPAASL